MVVVPEGNLSVPFAALEKVLSVAAVPLASAPEPAAVKPEPPIKRRVRTVRKKEAAKEDVVAAADTTKESVISLEDEDLR